MSREEEGGPAIAGPGFAVSSQEQTETDGNNISGGVKKIRKLLESSDEDDAPSDRAEESAGPLDLMGTPAVVSSDNDLGILLDMEQQRDDSDAESAADHLEQVEEEEVNTLLEQLEMEADKEGE
eukprot:3939062-Rhodomonas_salina.1